MSHQWTKETRLDVWGHCGKDDSMFNVKAEYHTSGAGTYLSIIGKDSNGKTVSIMLFPEQLAKLVETLENDYNECESADYAISHLNK